VPPEITETHAGDSNTNPVLDFGTTFPMTGTQAVAHQTWQKNVYMGTTMKFNPGAYWGYTDSFYVPNWNTAQYDTTTGNQISTGGGDNPFMPTPAPDYTGTPCFIANPCPSGYYCKLNVGHNIQQKGSCVRVSMDYWSGGAGQFTDSDMYNSMVHPPLILDPLHNGPAATGSNYDSGLGYYPGYPDYPGYGQPGLPAANSCASPSVCGYKAAQGTCWCDAKCQSTGDCCPDVAVYCSYTNFPSTPGPF
jgi:hypothetical protein